MPLAEGRRDSPVLCNVALKGLAAQLFGEALKAAWQGKLPKLDSRPLVSILSTEGALSDEQEASVCVQVEQALRRGAFERMRAEGLPHAARPGPEALSRAEIEVVSIGLPGSDPSPWDDCPAMAGQDSLRARPQGGGMAAGELIGPYSCECWLYPDWLQAQNAHPAAEWDDRERPCPHRSQAARKHDLGRYAADCELPEYLLSQLRRLGSPGAQLQQLQASGICEYRKLYGSAARLGCEVSLVNDPRRNLAARCDAEADFREGGPNAQLVTAMVCGLLPVMVMVASRDIPAGGHIMYSYGSAYWTLHQEEREHVREVEGVLEREAAAAARAEAALAREAVERHGRLAAEAEAEGLRTERDAALARATAAEMASRHLPLADV
ncbi:hypothetical protein GPECTOR_9g558 [Gonium pectorale]|uniref:SET domain-containing protein n=1 Tax=Gonium pectorale TaxID=33097 RepID=A0A150GRV6_GONPE|nr:hypothetical protein GPECTOR_9g558 [Gonium pectorale]|eukprot:KXZ52514.1 hypothetical protein GPECTOR_9g558 [Gonium pectorale]